jgi:hypothetical protein
MLLIQCVGGGGLLKVVQEASLASSSGFWYLHHITVTAAELSVEKSYPGVQCVASMWLYSTLYVGPHFCMPI